MQTIKTTLLLAFLCVFTTLDAQENQNKEVVYPKYAISVEPFYLGSGGLRLNFEKQLSSPKERLELSLMGYYLSHRDGNGDYWSTPGSDDEIVKGLKGIGAAASYRYYLRLPWYYISGGITYNHYNIDYDSYEYIPFIEDGLQFYRHELIDVTQKIDRLAANIIVGLNSSIRRRLFFDIYVGVGYAYSFYDDKKYAFNEDCFGYGWRGTYLVGGVKFGVTF